jgi:hypothetical protein
MSEQRHARVRELVVELVDTAPPAPPFPRPDTVPVARELPALPAPRRPRRSYVRPVLAAAVVIALLAVAIGAIALIGDTGDDAPPVITTPPNGQSIAYVGEDGLYVTGTRAGEPARVVEGGVLRPRFSHDGTYLAFEHDDGGLSVIRPERALDEPEQGVASGVERWEWAPDRDVLAVVDGDRVDVLDVDGTVLASWDPAIDFAWAPDGSLYVARGTELFRATLDEAGDRLNESERVALDASVVDGAARLYLAGVRADGTPMIWASPDDATPTADDELPLWVFDGETQRSLVRTVADRSQVRSSPREDAVAVVSSGEEDASPFVHVELCRSASGCAPVAGTGAPSYDPAWSSDGRRLAFVSEFQLFVEDVDAGSTDFVDVGVEITDPVWVSDDEIVFVRDGALRIVDVRTGVVRTLAPLGAGDASTSWRDRFAVLPAALDEPSPATTTVAPTTTVASTTTTLPPVGLQAAPELIGRHFEIDLPNNSGVYVENESRPFYQWSARCLDASATCHYMVFLIGNQTEPSPRLQGHLWLGYTPHAGHPKPRPLPWEVVDAYRIDLPEPLAIEFDGCRPSDLDQHWIPAVWSRDDEGDVVRAIRAWDLDAQNRRLREVPPDEVECHPLERNDS